MVGMNAMARSTARCSVPVGDVGGGGHIGCLYAHHDFQGLGAGKGVYDAIEGFAREAGIGRLFTEASITARPFFERQGFSLVRPETVVRRG
jgi:putative acetyltransferase